MKQDAREVAQRVFQEINKGPRTSMDKDGKLVNEGYTIKIDDIRTLAKAVIEYSKMLGDPRRLQFAEFTVKEQLKKIAALELKYMWRKQSEYPAPGGVPLTILVQREPPDSDMWTCLANVQLARGGMKLKGKAYWRLFDDPREQEESDA